MLYNIRTGHGGVTQAPMADIVIYAASMREIAAERVKLAAAEAAKEHGLDIEILVKPGMFFG